MQQYITGEAGVYSAKKEQHGQFEWNLPEYLPGISRIIRTDGLIEKCTFSSQDKNAFTDVSVKLCVVYVSDYEGKLKSAVFHEKIRVSFDEPFADAENAVVVPSCYINGISSKISGARKITAVISVTAAVNAVVQTKKELFCKNENENICTLVKKHSVCTKTTIPETYFESQQKAELGKDKEEIGEIIYSTAWISETNAVVNGTSVDFECEINVFTLYENETSDDGVSYSTSSFPFTVKDSISIPELSESHKAFICAEVCSVEPSVTFDSLGENKSVTFNIVYGVSGFLYCCEEKEIVEDAFLEKCECDVQISPVTFDSLMNYTSKICSVTENMKYDMGDVREISESTANILCVSYEYNEGKLYAAVKCRIGIFGANVSGELVSADCPVTFHVPIDGFEEYKSDILPDILLYILSCRAYIKEGSLLCDAEIRINGAITHKKTCNTVEKITPKENECQKDDFEMIICFPSPDDTLWNIAKKHRTNPDIITKANGLENGDISSKHALLIP